MNNSDDFDFYEKYGKYSRKNYIIFSGLAMCWILRSYWIWIRQENLRKNFRKFQEEQQKFRDIEYRLNENDTKISKILKEKKLDTTQLVDLLSRIALIWGFFSFANSEQDSYFLLKLLIVYLSIVSFAFVILDFSFKISLSSKIFSGVVALVVIAGIIFALFYPPNKPEYLNYEAICPSTNLIFAQKSTNATQCTYLTVPGNHDLFYHPKN